MTELNISHLEINDEKLRIAGIEEESIVDGPGIRFVVFTQGCKHKCKDCHNPETHKMDGGYEVDIKSIVEKIKSNALLDGITISGGEPFEQALKASILAGKVKEMGLNVVTYTGYTFEELLEKMKTSKEYEQLLMATDILIDGSFDINKRDLTIPFRGSSNQRIINVKKSFKNKTVVEERS